MTTKVKIESSIDSNGDVILNGVNTTEGNIHDAVLRPGESRELWITSSSMLTLTEKWPKSSPQSSREILNECGDDASKWAKAFVQTFPASDEGTMLCWFANAIETATAARAAFKKDK